MTPQFELCSVTKAMPLNCEFILVKVKVSILFIIASTLNLLYKLIAYVHVPVCVLKRVKLDISGSIARNVDIVVKFK